MLRSEEVRGHNVNALDYQGGFVVHYLAFRIVRSPSCSHTEIKSIEARSAKLSLVVKHAARKLKRMGAVPLLTAESMKAELAALNAKKEKLLADYKNARREVQEYETIKKNVDTLLSVPQEKINEISNILQKFVLSTCYLL